MRLPRWLYTVRLRLRSLFRHRDVEQELQDEMRDHIERQTEAYLAGGMSTEEARYAALRAMGGLEQRKEECRDVRRVSALQSSLQDAWYGARALRTSPSVTAVAVLTLALGTGANAAIFSVVNAVLLRPLPYASPDRIVSIHNASPISFALQPELHLVWADWADRLQSLDRIAAYATGELNLAAGGVEPERVAAAEVSRDFFEIFGLAPAAGRTFLPREEVAGHPSVAVLSDGLCRRFGAPRDVVGTTLLLNGTRTVVIGVMPAGFTFPESARLWLPTAWAEKDERLLNQALFHNVVGRLKAGVPPALAREELEAIQARAFAEVSNMPGRTFPNMRNAVSVVPLHDELVESSRSALWLLLGAVAFVWLIACADVANLLLARAVQSQREIALRAALGASRARLIRQALAESLLLSTIAWAGGLVLARWTLDAARPFIPARMLFVQSISLDLHVLLFLLGVSLVSGLLFGLFPVMHALRLDLNEPLKQRSASAPSGRAFAGRMRSVLAVSEVAMALVLLAGAGLLIKSFWRLMSVDPGFRPDSVLTARISLPGDLYQQSTRRAAFFEQTLAGIEALPGVAAASYVSDLPFGHAAGVAFRPELERETAAHLAAGQDQFARLFEASADYFVAMGIPVLAGRAFTDRDRQGAPPVVVINQASATRYWPGEDPVGRRISLPRADPTPVWAEIVGVVGDAKHSRLDEQPSPAYYIPLLQGPPEAAFLVARVSGGTSAPLTAIRHAVAQVDRALPLSAFMSMTDRVSESVAEPRFRTLLLGVFAGLALVLAAAGVYGVMSYSVAQRTREIGIRVAMGASRGNVLTLVLGQTLRLTLLGVAIGLTASWALTRVLASSLYGVTPHDRATLLGVSCLVCTVALVSSYLPARRAMRVDPLVALRHE